MGPVSETYRRDLDTLRALVGPAHLTQLQKLAEDIQDARERDSAGSEELDRRIAVYMSVRDEAIAAARGEAVLGG